MSSITVEVPRCPLTNQSHERREAAIADAEANLVRRADLSTESGTIEGTAGDTVRTYGLATCAGLAASGSAGNGGINKGK